MRRLISRILRRPYVRTSEEWEREYACGQWDFLDELEEMGRYWITAGYCASKFRNPSVLDIGCGTGLLEKKLRMLPYSSYLGVDFSLAALKQARACMPQSCQLVCADFRTFFVNRTFDVIIFMEALGPGMPVGDTLKRYISHLRPNGRIVISLFDGNRAVTLPFWEEVYSQLRVEDASRMENLPSRKSWTVALLAP